MNVIPLIKTILESFETLKYEIDSVNQKIRDIHSEQDDLLHELELTKFNACEGYQLSKELQILRVKRRHYKDQEEQMDMIRGVINKYKWIVNDLKPLVKMLEEKENHQIHRQYTPKIRTNLKLVKLKELQTAK